MDKSSAVCDKAVFHVEEEVTLLKNDFTFHHQVGQK